MSLVEIFIYISLTLILTLFLLAYILQVKKYIKNIDNINNNIIKKSLFIDILKRDLYSSSDFFHEWDLNNFVFRKKILNKNLGQESVDIGYLFLQDGIYRLEGVYNYLTCSWNQKTKSKIYNKNFLENFKIYLIKKINKIIAIKIEFNNNKEKEYLILNIQKGEFV